MDFEIGEVLTRAWQITWKHKTLWVFNMFPVLVSFLFLPVVFIPMFFLGPNALIHQGFVNRPSYVSLFIATDIFLTVLSILLYASGSASASLGIWRVENGRKQLVFKELFQDGLRFFWRILGVTLLIGAGILALFLVLFGCMTLIGRVTMGLGMICLRPLFVLIYPFLLIVYAWIEESQAALVADQMNVLDAISRARMLIREHFWKFVLISILIYFGLFLLSSIVTLPMMTPFFFLPIVMRNSQTGFDAQSLGGALMVGSLVILPILALVQGFSLTFMKSTYMIVYLRLTRPVVLRPALQESTV